MQGIVVCSNEPENCLHQSYCFKAQSYVNMF